MFNDTLEIVGRKLLETSLRMLITPVTVGTSCRWKRVLATSGLLCRRELRCCSRSRTKFLQPASVMGSKFTRCLYFYECLN
jgi:hypothetical protein